MILKPVTSSNIEAGHHAKASKLHVRFANGLTYEYPDVTADEHKAFVEADSIGKHFAQHIRGKGGKKLP